MAASGHSSLLRRFALISLVALVIASGASLLVSNSYNSADTLRTAKEIVDAVADESRAIVESKTYDELFLEPRGEEFQTARGMIQRVCSLLEVRYLYIYEMDGEQASRHVLLAVAGDASDEADLLERAKYGRDYASYGSQQELDALAGVQNNDPEVVTNVFGKNLSWYYPIVLTGHDDPLVMRIDIDDAVVTDRIFDNTLSFAIPMIVINVLVVMLEFGLLKRNVVNPLRIVSERMRGFVEHDASHEEPLRMGRNDEIGEIANSYNKMTVDIREYIGQIETMTQEQVAATTELAVAQRIQQGLVPPTKALEGDGYDAFAFMRMARAVGGDFYDLSRLKDGRVCFMLADVSGKGVSAALFMAMSLTLLYDRLRTCFDPAQALNQANDIIAGNNPENMFVTLVAGIFDPRSGTLTYANAGHTPPLVVGKGFENPDPGIALGLFEDAGIVNETIRLKPGEGVLLYTDGATEAVDGKRRFFGEERLAEAVRGATCSADAVHGLVESIDAFVGASEQFDDLTLLSLFAHDVEANHD